MSNVERTTSWQQIQQGVKEACDGQSQTGSGIYGKMHG